MTTPPKVAYSIDFAITLTLSPCLYNRTTMIQSECARNAFLHCIKNDPFVRHTSVMEETKDYNIHIHSILSIPLNDKVKQYGARRYIFDLFRNKNFGKVKDINPVTSYPEWTSYIMKDFLLDGYSREYYPLIGGDHYDLTSLKNDYYESHPEKIRPKRN